MTTLVIGARGAVGRHVVAGLLDAGEAVRATVRDLATADVDPRAEVVRADLTEQESLVRALDGVSRVFLYATPKGAPVFAEAAARAAVEHVVVLSSGSVLLPWAAGNAIAVEHREIEEVLTGAGTRVIPIRPLVLAGNAANWARTVRRDRTVELVHPESRSAPIHEADIAAVAVAALRGTAGDEASGLLTGGEVLTQRRQVELIAVALGEPVAVREIDEDHARAQLGAEGDVEQVFGQTPLIAAQFETELREGNVLTDGLQDVGAEVCIARYHFPAARAGGGDAQRLAQVPC